MRRFDEELIAALAEGKLDPARAEEVEAAVQSDPEARQLLRDHREALRALAAVAPASLRDDERSRVRESVAAALGLDAPEPLATEPSRRRRVPWPALVASAAGLFVVLAITPFVGMLTTGGSAFDADTAALRQFEREAQDLDVADPSDPLLPLRAGEDDGDVDFDPDAQAPTGTVVVPPPDEDDSDTTTTSPVTLTADQEALLGFIREMYGADDDGFGVPQALAGDTMCRAEAREQFGEAEDGNGVFVTDLVLDDGRSILVFYTRDEDGEIARIIAIDPDGCATLASE